MYSAADAPPEYRDGPRPCQGRSSVSDAPCATGTAPFPILSSVASRLPAPPNPRARDLVLRYGWNPSAYQILNPGIDLWFADAGDGVVGYADYAGVRVVAGEPVCPSDRLAGIVAEFDAAASAAGHRVCYLAAESRLAERLRGTPGYTEVILGAHPIVDPDCWPATVAVRPSLRAQLHRARNKAVTIEEWSPEQATGHPALRACLARWLETRSMPPLHFLVETDTLDRLEDRRVFVARQAGEVPGFVVASPIPRRNGWLIEQVVRRPDAPNGTAELLIDAALRTFRADGADHVALGVAPLSDRAGRRRTGPLLRAALTWVRAHSRRFYNFTGLEAFKAKFRPERWEPVYAISHEPRFSLRTLWAIGGVYCGRSPLSTGAVAAGEALRQEIRWLAGGRRRRSRRER